MPTNEAPKVPSDVRIAAFDINGVTLAYSSPAATNYSIYARHLPHVNTDMVVDSGSGEVDRNFRIILPELGWGQFARMADSEHQSWSLVVDSTMKRETRILLPKEQTMRSTELYEVKVEASNEHGVQDDETSARLFVRLTNVTTGGPLASETRIRRRQVGHDEVTIEFTNPSATLFDIYLNDHIVASSLEETSMSMSLPAAIGGETSASVVAVVARDSSSNLAAFDLNDANVAAILTVAPTDAPPEETIKDLRIAAVSADAAIVTWGDAGPATSTYRVRMRLDGDNGVWNHTRWVNRTYVEVELPEAAILVEVTAANRYGVSRFSRSITITPATAVPSHAPRLPYIVEIGADGTTFEFEPPADATFFVCEVRVDIDGDEDRWWPLVDPVSLLPRFIIGRTSIPETILKHVKAMTYGSDVLAQVRVRGGNRFGVQPPASALVLDILVRGIGYTGRDEVSEADAAAMIELYATYVEGSSIGLYAYSPFDTELEIRVLENRTYDHQHEWTAVGSSLQGRFILDYIPSPVRRPITANITYTVHAVSSIGFSSELIVESTTTPPGSIDGLWVDEAANISPATFNMVWKRTRRAVHYDVYTRQHTPFSPSAWVLAAGEVVGEQVALKGLTSGAVEFTVVAVNNHGSSLFERAPRLVLRIANEADLGSVHGVNAPASPDGACNLEITAVEEMTSSDATQHLRVSLRFAHPDASRFVVITAETEDHLVFDGNEAGEITLAPAGTSIVHGSPNFALVIDGDTLSVSDVPVDMSTWFRVIAGNSYGWQVASKSCTREYLPTRARPSAAVTSLAVTRVTTTSALVEWILPVDSWHATVQVWAAGHLADEDDEPATVLASINYTASHIYVHGLEERKPYTIRVTAGNDEGNDDEGRTVVAVPVAAPSGPPAAARPALLMPSAVMLEWDAVEGVDQYEVSMLPEGSEIDDGTNVRVVESTAEHWVGLVEGRMYRSSIRPINLNARSEVAYSLTVTPSGSEPTMILQDGSFYALRANESTLDLAWSYTPDATYFNIKCREANVWTGGVISGLGEAEDGSDSTNSNNEVVEVSSFDTSGVHDTRIVAHGLRSRYDYACNLTSANNHGVGNTTVTIVERPQSKPSQRVTGLQVDYATTDAIVLRWDALGGVDRYTIQAKVNGVGPCLPLSTNASGPDPLQPCLLPFTWAGVVHDDTCSTLGGRGGPWCATQVDALGVAVPGRWGYCAECEWETVHKEGGTGQPWVWQDSDLRDTPAWALRQRLRSRAGKYTFSDAQLAAADEETLRSALFATVPESFSGATLRESLVSTNVRLTTTDHKLQRGVSYSFR